MTIQKNEELSEIIRNLINEVFAPKHPRAIARAAMARKRAEVAA